MVERCVRKATRVQAQTRARAPTPTYTHVRAHTQIAFPRQQWFHERVSMLRHTLRCVACLVCY
jgi:hypothetical protein